MVDYLLSEWIEKSTLERDVCTKEGGILALEASDKVSFCLYDLLWCTRSVKIRNLAFKWFFVLLL